MQSLRAEADGRALLLLDELGTGTDPAEGAALGAALLQTLVKGAFLLYRVVVVCVCIACSVRRHFVSHLMTRTQHNRLTSPTPDTTPPPPRRHRQRRAHDRDDAPLVDDGAQVSRPAL
jgi:hypothetical protein